MRKINFNENWTFKTKEHQISNLTLPHDAQLLDGRRADSPGGSGHGYFVGNVYEYEKHFDVPADWSNQHVEILFEGVYRNCEVCLNGKKLGEHRYGYTQFTFDMNKIPIIISKFYMMNIMEAQDFLNLYPANYQLPDFVINKLAQDLHPFNQPADWAQYADYFNKLNVSKSISQPKRQMIRMVIK